MRIRKLHRWKVTPARARQIQIELRRRVIRTDRLPSVRCVAGADVAFDLQRGRAFAGVILYSFPELRELERVWVERPLEFPYVPGLLSFREAPALLEAFALLRGDPDVIFVDGHGYAHPRRFGIACHLGLLLGKAAVGCAKSLLIGTHADAPLAAGKWTPLCDGEEIIGAVVRTRAGVKPIYVSQGHRVSLPRAVELALAVCDGYRIPKPTRDADRFVEEVKRGRRAGRK
jgi:deoxyribonuclease V